MAQAAVVAAADPARRHAAPRRLRRARRPPATSARRPRREQVGEWQEIYSDEYTEIGTGRATTEDFAGWDSSYDGQPIPLDGHAGVARGDRRADPRAARRAASWRSASAPACCCPGWRPDCEAYWATDFAAPVIAQARARTCGRPGAGRQGRAALPARPRPERAARRVLRHRRRSTPSSSTSPSADYLRRWCRGAHGAARARRRAVRRRRAQPAACCRTLPDGRSSCAPGDGSDGRRRRRRAPCERRPVAPGEGTAASTRTFFARPRGSGRARRLDPHQARARTTTS